MKHYIKITIWENNRRLNKLFEFRQLVIQYFNNSTESFRGPSRVEEKTAQEARIKISRSMKEIHEIILQAEVSPILIHTPPPMIGGYQSNVDIIRNIFNLDRFGIEPNQILDVIDMAIGTYESNHTQAIVRTFNPLFYLFWALDTISELPFFAIGKLGFNIEEIKSSVIGRFFKGLFYLITVAAALLTILHFLDSLEPVKQFTRKLLGFNH